MSGLPSLDVNTIFGPSVVGTFVSCLLSSLFLIESIRYWAHFGRKDKLCFKIWVATMCILVPLSLLANTAYVYESTVRHWGDPTYMLGGFSNWPLVLLELSTGLAGASCQTFLLYSLSKVSPHRWFSLAIIPPFALVLVLAAVGWLAVVINHENELTKFNNLMISIWLAASAAEDLGVAIALLFAFSTFKRQYAATTIPLHTLGLRAVASGSLTALHAILVLILFHAYKTATVAIGATAPLATVYALTMIAALNYRQIIEDQRNRSAESKPAVSFARSIRLEHVRTVHHDGKQGLEDEASEADSAYKEEDLYRSLEKGGARRAEAAE